MTDGLKIFITLALALLDAGEFKVGDFGARGDGLHDDGPAIAAAFEAAKADGIPSTVVFEEKTCRLGDNPAAWHHFQLVDHEDLVIEGNGATLLGGKGNLAFHFNGGRNITVRPCMRHALLARAQNMTIENNTVDCSRGGVIGLSLSFASGQDDARLRNVRVVGNTFICPDNLALVALRPYREADGSQDARDLTITGNTFHLGSAKAIRVHGVKGLDLRDNRFLKDGKPRANPQAAGIRPEGVRVAGELRQRKEHRALRARLPVCPGEDPGQGGRQRPVALLGVDRLGELSPRLPGGIVSRNNGGRAL